MRKKIEFRVGDFVNYALPVAGQPHIGAGRIIKVVSIPGGQLLTMDWNARGWRLELDTTDPNHSVFRPADATSGVVITPSGVACEAQDQHHF